MSAKPRLGREVLREGMNRGARLAYQRNHPVQWAPGEQKRMIDEAIAQGRVTKCEPSKSEYRTFLPLSDDTFSNVISGRWKTGKGRGSDLK